MKKIVLCLSVLFMVVTVACAKVAQAGEEGRSEVVVETAVATASDLASITLINDGEQAVQELMNCMAREPESLFLYATYGKRDLNARSATMLQQALFERLVVQVNGTFEARGLTHIPTLENGEVQVVEVLVGAGERVLNADGNVVTLVEGTAVIDASGNIITFNGTPILMSQMTVDFTLQPFIWSDGTPVTAKDSVFSFEVAARPDMPANKTRIKHTTNYEAISTHVVRWTGVAGLVDAQYPLNVWTPLPKHQLSHFSTSALLTSHQSGRRPLSYGRYMVTEWIPGSHIVLSPNPHYAHDDPTQPLTRITYEFLPPDTQF